VKPSGVQHGSSSGTRRDKSERTTSQKTLSFFHEQKNPQDHHLSKVIKTTITEHAQHHFNKQESRTCKPSSSDNTFHNFQHLSNPLRDQQ